MKVEFMYNASEADRVGKTLSSVATYDCVMKDASNLINVDILLEASEPPKANYMYIEEYGRYYFITDISSVRNGLWTIGGHVDVLETYKNEIRSQTAIIARNQYIYNLYLPDDRITVEQKTQIQKLLYDTDVLSRNHILLCVALDTDSV